MTSEPSAVPPGLSSIPRSKMELLYRDMLQESFQLVTHMEQLTVRQEEIAHAMQAVPATVRQAGLDAAANASHHAARSLLEASRSLGKCSGDVRIAARMATNALPVAAWRIGLLCAACAFFGGAFSAALVVLLLQR